MHVEAAVGHLHLGDLDQPVGAVRQQVDAGHVRGASKSTWIQWRLGSRVGSASQEVAGSPSNAAYGLCSGNWAISGL